MYPLGIPGITGKPDDKFVFNKDANEQTMRQLVDEIQPRTRVTFYDKNYHSPSDPGAYVSFMRVNEQYIMQRSNSGWLNRWKSITVEKLVRYLSECSKYNMGQELGQYEQGIMSVFFSVNPPQKKWWQFWK